jgi:hypothetical protein
MSKLHGVVDEYHDTETLVLRSSSEWESYRAKMLAHRTEFLKSKDCGSMSENIYGPSEPVRYPALLFANYNGGWESTYYFVYPNQILELFGLKAPIPVVEHTEQPGGYPDFQAVLGSIEDRTI